MDHTGIPLLQVTAIPKRLMTAKSRKRVENLAIMKSRARAENPGTRKSLERVENQAKVGSLGRVENLAKVGNLGRAANLGKERILETAKSLARVPMDRYRNEAKYQERRTVSAALFFFKSKLTESKTVKKEGRKVGRMGDG